MILEPRNRSNNITTRRNSGFTLIELMIVVAVIAIILTLALPMYGDFMIRSKIAEGLNVSKAAKTAVATTCVEDPTISPLTDARAGYEFETSKYVNDVTITGTCNDPVITIVTHNTGATADPTLTLTGEFRAGVAKITWVCTSNAGNHLIPDTCRS